MTKGARALSVVAMLVLTTAARAQPVEQFYHNRTITIVVGFTPGGGYDLYARLLGRHLSRHIPGNPIIVVQNMPGAGSLRATRFVYSVAPKDGTVIATGNRSIITDPLLNGADFDATTLSWIGTVTNETSVCAMWHTSPVTSWEHMFRREFTLGGSAPGSDPDTFGMILRNVFGAKVRLVTGYPGGNDINLAIERGEIEGRCGWSWTSLKSQKAEWLSSKKINLLAQFGMHRHVDLPNVPLVLDRASDDGQRQILRLLIAAQFVGRPFFASPGIPDDRKAALRNAFDATMKDPQFLAEAKGLDLEISPVSGGMIDKFLADLYRTPKDIVKKAVAAMQR